MVVLVIGVIRGAVCFGVVASNVVLGRMVLNIVSGEADETVCGLVGVLRISEVNFMEEVNSPGSCVTKDV